MHSDDADDIFESSASAEDETQPAADLPEEDAVGAVNDPVSTKPPDDGTPFEDDEDPASLFADWEPPAPVAEQPRRWTRARLAIAAGVVVLLALLVSAHHSHPPAPRAPATKVTHSRSHHPRDRRHHHTVSRRTRAHTSRPSKPRPRRQPSHARPHPTVTSHSSQPRSSSSPRAPQTGTASEFTNEFTP